MEHPGGQSKGNDAARSGGSGKAVAATFPFDANTIRNDLTVERPLWPFSSYCPAKGEPNLIANEDLSQDELRARFYQARAANNESLYPEDELLQKVTAVYNNVLNNLDEAVKVARSRSAKAPAESATSAFGVSSFGNQTAAFSSNATPSSAFANPSAFAKPSAFGGSAFGQTSTPSAFVSSTTIGGSSASGAFASPSKSSFGQSSFATTAPPQSGFGNSTAPRSGFAAPAFGSPAAAPLANTTSAFGQSSPFSKPPGGGTAFGQSAFGKTTAPPTQSAFGVPNAFSGKPAFGSTAFGSGVASFTAAPSAFASTSAFGTGVAPAQSVFGSAQTAKPASGSSAFGTAASTTSAFSHTATPPSAFQGVPQLQPGDYPDSSLKEEDLTAEDLAAYKADAFDVLKIPLMPPPLSVR